MNKLPDFLTQILASLNRRSIDLSQPSVLQLNDMLCMPLTSLATDRLQMQGGLYSKTGQYIPLSGLITSQQTIVGDGHLPLPNSAPSLAGKSLYLGVCHYHFGHFLIETCSRLWSLKPDEIKQFDHIILMTLTDYVPEFAMDLFKLLGVEEHIRIIKEPLFLDQVTLPAPAIEYPYHVYQVINKIQHLFTNHHNTALKNQAIFLSRSRLVPGHSRVIIGEDLIEQALQHQGVTIFHPQQHSLAEQITTLRQYKTVISFAGSALHTLILTGGNKQVIAYSARKIPVIFPKLDKALNNQAHYLRSELNCVKPGMAELPVGFKPQLIDPRIILKKLKQQKIISSDALPNYGSKTAHEKELSRYNTALLLRWVLEASQQQSNDNCQTFIKTFSQKYPLDETILAQAKNGSALMRTFFN